VANANLLHRLSLYWGILKWPSLGEFGWPPGSSWKEFLLRLKERGLSGVEFVVSDDHAGLKKAIFEVLKVGVGQWNFNGRFSAANPDRRRSLECPEQSFD
jgi:hypothetical protein